MSLSGDYAAAKKDEQIARLRRAFALRAMLASGMTQREIAQQLGISQPAVSQQLRSARDLSQIHPEDVVEAAAPILTRIAGARGFSKLAVFGSVARKEAGPGSDIDLLVEAPPGTAIGDLLALQGLISEVVGRPVDLVTYGGLKPRVDDDIRREAVPL